MAREHNTLLRAYALRIVKVEIKSTSDVRPEIEKNY